MYQSVFHFRKDWAYEADNTLKVFKLLNNEIINREFSPLVRTPGRLAWHIITTIPEMLGAAGLPVAGPDYTEPMPKTGSEFVSIYKRCSDSLVQNVTLLWNEDGMLAEEIPMYGEQWSRSLVLSYLMFHQTHHRGQLILLMRMGGIAVPGVYGMAREEWIEIGREPMP
jgi:uncharacterized damage-inducible protein DinB